MHKIFFAIHNKSYCQVHIFDRSGQKQTVENLWRQFFSDPSQWWDHRQQKGNLNYPDFKHKKRREALWIDGKFNPPWVAAQLAALPPDILELNAFAWNAKLARCVKAGQYEKAMDLFQSMRQESITPDSFTFVSVLNACANLQAIEEGRYIHSQIKRSGCESNVYVGNSLVDMYTKCGSIDDARKVFDNMPIRNVVSWNSIILGYTKCRQGLKALELSRQMYQDGLDPVPGTFVALVNACASVAALEEGRRVHDQITQSGCESDVRVSSSLIHMYARCGRIEEAWKLFEKMPMHNMVSWSSIILGYVKCGQGRKALELFHLMQHEGVEPDAIMFVAVLNACAGLAALKEGRNVHDLIIQRNWESNAYVGSSLIDMYAKCGRIEDAWEVFKKISTHDVVSWTAMIMGYVKCGQGHKALKLSEVMQNEGVKPVPATFVALLNACASLGALEEGRQIHEKVVESGCMIDVFVGSSLVDMYAKCGSINDAWKVFKKMSTRNVVSWNAIILGHVKCGQGQKALELYREMQNQGMSLVSGTYVGVLNACTSVGALKEGIHIHKQIMESGCESDMFVASSLIDMYSQCGSIINARKVFENMPSRDVVAWSTMLNGYAMHGYCKDALRLFEQMCQDGVQMDRVTFVSLLSACSHSGLVDEGWHYFDSMNLLHSCAANVEHYACMVDLLSRSGRMHEAEDLTRTMPCEPNVTVWMALLGACRVHGQIKLGEQIAKQILQIDPTNEAVYVLLANIYATAGKWYNSTDGQRDEIQRGVVMQPGCTWIEVNDELHSFQVDLQEHPQMCEIYEELERLSLLMHEVGYMPDTQFVLHEEEEEKKDFLLCHCSETLAIAFGLKQTPPGTPLHIFKNLSMCGGCHSAAKCIAKIVGRQIVVRDENRFHCFEDGLCSCKDYW